MKAADFEEAVKNIRQECLVFRANKNWGIRYDTGEPEVLKGDTLVYGWQWRLLDIRSNQHVNYPASSMTLLGTVLVANPYGFADTMKRLVIAAGYKERS